MIIKISTLMTLMQMCVSCASTCYFENTISYQVNKKSTRNLHVNVSTTEINLMDGGRERVGPYRISIQIKNVKEQFITQKILLKDGAYSYIWEKSSLDLWDIKGNKKLILISPKVGLNNSVVDGEVLMCNTNAQCESVSFQLKMKYQKGCVNTNWWERFIYTT